MVLRNTHDKWQASPNITFGKIGYGFAEDDQNGEFSVELQGHKTSVEGYAHLSTYKNAR